MTELSMFFHFTCEDGWTAIEAAESIEPKSNAADHADGPKPLIWLTDSETPADTGLCDPARTAIRISLSPAAPARYWTVWTHLVPPANVLGIEGAGGVPSTWYVSDAPVTANHFGKVVRVATGEVLKAAPVAPARACVMS
ncbi:hypothetical protein [Streptomyces sp. A1136]|uniref:hypothetical protein n=1 Tax=Streptomyces sp. A1136 TaxID=2563102 RepID=UPI00109EBAB7|nr:hypothetical protein [Streptomyces sp. A1136]THA47629.1 hypothetical protein E6R62_31025 [Streptomyces sp. A1136]